MTPMTKAWDVQNLLDRAKTKLAPIAGLLAADVVDWTADSLKMSDKNLVKILGGVVGELKEPILREINKHLPQEVVDMSVPVSRAEGVPG